MNTASCDEVSTLVIHERRRPNVSLTRIYLKNGQGRAIAGIVMSTSGRTSLTQKIWFADAAVCSQHGEELICGLEKISKEQGCQFVYVDELDSQAEALCLTHGFRRRNDLSLMIGPLAPSLLFKYLHPAQESRPA